MDLSIVIISWNVKELLKKCLNSAIKYIGDLKVEIFVIDNASNDGSAEMIKKEFLNKEGVTIHLIANPKNVGFAAACNQGILSSQGRYILLLNPDTEILNSGLQKIVSFMDRTERAGIAGCRHLNPDWTLQPSVRRFPKLLPILLIITKIAKVAPHLKSIDKYLAKDFDYKRSQPVNQVAGSFFLIRQKLIDDIGLLDEKFYIWFEEVDFCKRAVNEGWQIWYNKDSEIIHYGGQSFNQRIAWTKQLIFCKSALYYFQKHGFFR